MKTKTKLTFAGALVAAALILSGCGQASASSRGSGGGYRSAAYAEPYCYAPAVAYYGRAGFWSTYGRSGWFSGFRGGFLRGSWARAGRGFRR